MWSRVIGISLSIAFLFQPMLPAGAASVAAERRAAPARPAPVHSDADQLPTSAPDALAGVAHYQLHLDNLPPLCSAGFQLQNPGACPNLGPGEYASQIVAAGLPYPFPSLPIAPVSPYRGLTPSAYARVITSTAPVYRHPFDALAGLPPLRRFETGYDFVSLLGQVTIDGRAFYQINRGEFMPAEDLQLVQPSSFQGRFLSSPPAAPVGWILNNVQLSTQPGQPPPPDAPHAGRYQSFDVLGVQRVGDWNWYLIGPNQWIEQRNVALVQPTSPGGASGTVIAVDTYEQSLGVYVDGALIFATLVSSGSSYFPTRPGTFHVWAKLDAGKMSGTYLPDRRDYYYLEDVPWILYYDGARALHGAYWHDNFGIRSSHGCVNLSPRDARWLFGFAQVGSTVVIFSSI
jgi:L,D-transpeptidase catalytic domain